jgi:hypothetical protein
MLISVRARKISQALLSELINVNLRVYHKHRFSRKKYYLRRVSPVVAV